MNLLKLAGLSFLLFILTAPARGAGPFRTDINPALLYYQAYTLGPDLSEGDRQYLTGTEWRGRSLDSRFEDLIARYDNTFKFLRQAAHSQVNCDWGIDLTQGPETLLPGLAKAKAQAQTARLRVRWHLQHNRPAEAREDLLAALALGRNIPTDGVLISALVGIAIQQILGTAVAENFSTFDSESLEQIVAGFEASPALGSIQRTIAAEKTSFYQWFIARITEIQAETPGDEAPIMAKIRALFARTMVDGDNPDPGLPERLIAGCGGTSVGILTRFKELDPLYDELAALLGLPFEQFGAASKAFEAKLASHPNPLAPQFLPAVSKARSREFVVAVRHAMLRAAAEYRLHGNGAFQKVLDPCGHGPFQMERVVLDGVDRGFMLKSELNSRGYEEALAFVEKDGPPFYLDGKNAGKPLPEQPPGK